LHMTRNHVAAPSINCAHRVFQRPSRHRVRRQ
jgi:hypothetical protein